ncbi:MAG: CHAP domain-containing protein [Clostridiaceae bacterium]|nr:CHAP domain-containing protein [Clostridiaceae bacterium]
MKEQKKIVSRFLCSGILAIGIILSLFSMNTSVSAEVIEDSSDNLSVPTETDVSATTSAESAPETELVVPDAISPTIEQDDLERTDITLSDQEISLQRMAESFAFEDAKNVEKDLENSADVASSADNPDSEPTVAMKEEPSQEDSQADIINNFSRTQTVPNPVSQEQVAGETSNETKPDSEPETKPQPEPEPEPVLETLYVQTATLAVRPAKNSTALLGLLTKGTQVNGYREGVWLRITYNNKTAYVAAKFTDVTPPPIETLYVQTRSLAVRPAKNSTVSVGSLRRGTQVNGYREGAWIRITYNGNTAYVATKFTDVTLPAILETFYVQTTTLAVRPAKNSKVSLGILSKGAKISGYCEGAWIRITYNGKTAYVATKFTDVKAPPLTTFYVKSRSLAIRPARNSTKLLGLFSKGAKLEGYREGAWIRFIYKGKTAYIATKFTSYEVVDPRTGVQKLDMVLEEARKWIGTNERNMGHKYIIDTYNNQPNLPRGMKVGYRDHWCDVFVSFIGIQTNTTDIIGSESYVPYHMQFFMNKGQWIEDGTITPRSGDLAFFNWDATSQPNYEIPGHVSIVESVHDGYFYSIDANMFPEEWGIGYVERNQYAIGESVIRGFARPVYK